MSIRLDRRNAARTAWEANKTPETYLAYKKAERNYQKSAEAHAARGPFTISWERMMSE